MGFSRNPPRSENRSSHPIIPYLPHATISLWERWLLSAVWENVIRPLVENGLRAHDDDPRGPSTL